MIGNVEYFPTDAILVLLYSEIQREMIFEHLFHLLFHGAKKDWLIHDPCLLLDILFSCRRHWYWKFSIYAGVCLMSNEMVRTISLKLWKYLHRAYRSYRWCFGFVLRQTLVKKFFGEIVSNPESFDSCNWNFHNPSLGVFWGEGLEGGGWVGWCGEATKCWRSVQLYVVNLLVGLLYLYDIMASPDKFCRKSLVLQLIVYLQPRYVVNQVTAGDYDCPKKVLKFLTDLHAAFRMLNLRNDFLRKKFDGSFQFHFYVFQFLSCLLGVLEKC